ncbi:hypothetical protein L3X38_042759 [Prunus dulcis]|uniref:Uncharacterized protein n=1 Tax=Prunus dulcis TaxID=3755 RepID=A0AAD4YM97_PRUDU|nr:hypothetical protein L3X38_042759 [Prunus dulcis]
MRSRADDVSPEFCKDMHSRVDHVSLEFCEDVTYMVLRIEGILLELTAYEWGLVHTHDEENDLLPLQEIFLDEKLFTISSTLPWYVDIVNYLACGVVPKDFTYQQRKKFLATVKYNFWDDLCLYKHCPD